MTNKKVNTLEESKKDFFEGYSENLNFYWENCDPTFAHLNINKWLKSESHLHESWRSAFLGEFSLKGKTVADYGIGGGYLGAYLYLNEGISGYIGVDISSRSIEVARSNLAQFENSKFFQTPCNFSDLNADVFISLACIQHFPSLDYLYQFLENLNDSGVAEVILQIRFSPETIFTENNPVLSCRTNARDILLKLTNYTCNFASPIAKNKYQYLGFQNVSTIGTGNGLSRAPLLNRAEANEAELRKIKGSFLYKLCRRLGAFRRLG